MHVLLDMLGPPQDMCVLQHHLHDQHVLPLRFKLVAGVPTQVTMPPRLKTYRHPTCDILCRRSTSPSALLSHCIPQPLQYVLHGIHWTFTPTTLPPRNFTGITRHPTNTQVGHQTLTRLQSASSPKEAARKQHKTGTRHHRQHMTHSCAGVVKHPTLTYSCHHDLAAVRAIAQPAVQTPLPCEAPCWCLQKVVL